MTPLIVLEPIVHETIWGGPRIARLTGVPGEKTGHLYSVYCREGCSSRILNGKWQGKYLNDVFPLWKEEFHMGQYAFFPLTVALTEADEHLSIQVHPDDAAANAIEHAARGKRESWYFLEPPKAGYIYNGCRCRTEEACEKLIQENRYLEMADTLPVKAGDYVFVEPGTLHAITAGSLVYEIEEGADSTYRFFDFERVDKDGNRRELHIEKARRALRMHQKSVVKHYDGENWIQEETYATRRLEQVTAYKNGSQTLECLTMIQGQAMCDGVPLAAGMTVMLWPGETLRTAAIRLAIVSKRKEEQG